MPSMIISYKKWIIVAVVLFGIGMVFGAVLPGGTAGFMLEEIAALEELAGMLASLPSILVALIIFIKNVFVLLLCFALSPLLCLPSILSLFLNGMILAFVAVVVSREMSVGFVLAGLLPHGIIEIPAFIMGQATALSFGAGLILALFRKERRSQLLPDLKKNLRYLMIAIGLLLPAAFIEAYITPLLIS